MFKSARGRISDHVLVLCTLASTPSLLGNRDNFSLAVIYCGYCVSWGQKLAFVCLILKPISSSMPQIDAGENINYNSNYCDGEGVSLIMHLSILLRHAKYRGQHTQVAGVVACLAAYRMQWHGARGWVTQQSENMSSVVQGDQAVCAWIIPTHQ